MQEIPTGKETGCTALHGWSFSISVPASLSEVTVDPTVGASTRE